MLAFTFLLTPRLARASECGAGGNTYWRVTTPELSARFTLDRTNVYCTSGAVLRGTRRAGEDSTAHTNLFSRDFLNVELGRPLALEHPEGTANLFVCGSDGYVYCVDANHGATQWGRSTKRATCSSDTIIATPVAQLRHLSNSNFQNAVATDLVFVGAANACSTTNVNRIIAYRADTGAIVWSHNATGTYRYGTIYGMAVDYERNVLHVTAGDDDSQSLPTVFALNSVTGARLWTQPG